MKTWQWVLLISIILAFLTLLTSALFIPISWEMTPMMARGHGYWGEFYSPWGMSWLFVSMRTLFWLLPIAVATLLTMLILNSQRPSEVTELVDED